MKIAHLATNFWTWTETFLASLLKRHSMCKEDYFREKLIILDIFFRISAEKHCAGSKKISAGLSKQ